MIRYFTEDTTFTLKGKRLISKWLREVAEGRGYEIGELNYIFCSDPYLLAINRQFLGHDYETDIITFDNSEDYLLETGRKG
ncbi:MAG: rRNA maturation RNAse YbeY, partial [Bacteroidales bacterium]|nr:rRNA maturation RNAse YbeY [Bacteroidales bacterium]